MCGPKGAQVQLYLPRGANVPTWEGTLASPGEYDWTVRLRWWCGLTSNYFDHALVNIRLHRSTTYVDAVYCYRRCSVVCRSLGLSVTIVSPAKKAEPIELPFGLWTLYSMAVQIHAWRGILKTWGLPSVCGFFVKLLWPLANVYREFVTSAKKSRILTNFPKLKKIRKNSYKNSLNARV